tara:strand:- start:407 stop:1531 length:1125 start_codon:yes stop_codon:yes gene_type:complete
MSDLGYMEKLLDGVEVEWIDIKDLCDVITTGKLNANAMEDDGIYPFFTCNEYPYKINSYAFDLEAILISGNGSQVGHLNYYNGKFNAYQRTYVIGDFKDNVKVMYFFYYLNHTLKNYITKNSRKGSVPYITMPMLENFKIPIPSLNVQAEIVRILDVFTELTAELTAELVARKQQYEYYRDQLLTFDNDKAEVKTLEEICIMRAGQHISASKILADIDIDHIYPCFGGNGIRGFVNKNSHDGSYLLVGRQGALCGNVHRMNGKFYATEHAVVVTAKEGINIDWAFHMLTLMNLNQYASKSAQPGLAVGKLASLKVSVPPLDEQERIASILDKFDTLTTSLTEGLPREMALRQQQYEYYRELLLSFPKPEVVIHD